VFGCKSGLGCLYLADKGLDVTGIDTIQKALSRGRDIAAARGINVSLREETLCDPPSELQGVFDFAFDRLALASQPSSKEAIRSAATYLKPGGVLLTVYGKMAKNTSSDLGQAAMESAKRFEDSGLFSVIWAKPTSIELALNNG